MLAVDVVWQLPQPGTYTLITSEESFVLRDVDLQAIHEALRVDVDTLQLVGTSGDDTIVIIEDTVGLPTFPGDLSDITGVRADSFEASARTNSDGNKNIGFHFDSGGGDDTFLLELASSQTLSYFVESGDGLPGQQGNLNIDAVTTFSFSQLPSLIVRGAGGTMDVDLGDATNTTAFDVAIDPSMRAGVGSNRLTGDGDLDSTYFSGFDSLQLFGGPTIRQYSVTSLSAVALDSVRIEGASEENNEFVISGLPSTTTMELFGGALDDTFFINAQTQAAALGTITLHGNGNANADRVHVLGDGVNATTFAPDTSNVRAAQLIYGFAQLQINDIDSVEISDYSIVNYPTSNPEDSLSVTDVISPSGAPSLQVTSDNAELMPLVVNRVGLLAVDLTGNDTPEQRDSLSINNAIPGHGVDLIAVRTGAGPDYVQLIASVPELAISLDMGSESDRVEVGGTQSSLQAVAGSLSIIGREHDETFSSEVTVTAIDTTITATAFFGDTVAFLDRGNTEAASYVLDRTSLLLGDHAIATFAEIELVSLSTTNGDAQVTVGDLGERQTFEIVGQEGNDTVIVPSTTANNVLSIQSGGGNDTIEIGNTLSGSILSVVAGIGNDTISLASSNAGSGVRIQGNQGNDVISVAATEADSAVLIEGGDGNDQFQLGDTNLSPLLGAIEVDGGAHDANATVVLGFDYFGEPRPLMLESGDSIRFDDSSEALDMSYEFLSDSVLRNGTTSVRFSTMETVSLATTSANATVAITETLPATRVIIDSFAGDDSYAVATMSSGSAVVISGGDGSDTLDVTGTNTIPTDSILRFDGQADDDRLQIDAVTTSSNQSYLFDGESFVRSLDVPASVSYANLEVVELSAGSGVDNITIEPSDTVAFTIHGGAPVGTPSSRPGDRLAVNTSGLTNVVVPTLVTAGTITADEIQPIVFDGIEQLGDALEDDQYEDNNSIATAFPLGEVTTTLLTRLTLPPGDRDVFTFSPSVPGAFVLVYSASENAAPATIVVRDTQGTELISLESELGLAADSFAVIPSVTYVIDITASSNIPSYQLAMETLPLPLPSAPILAPSSDSGIPGDNTTSSSEPLVTFQVDLDPLAAAGIPLLTPEQLQAANTPGLGVRVLVDGDFAGYAIRSLDAPQQFQFQLSDLAEGTHEITTDVQVYDVSSPTQPASGAGSQPLAITIDATGPVITELAFVGESDSGTSTSDGITNIKNQTIHGSSDPGLTITAEAVNADDLAQVILLGDTVVDNSGNWQINFTLTPDARYQLRFSAMDTAGNRTETTLPQSLWIDTQAPSAPLLDLISDNGSNTTDNVTSTSRPIIGVTTLDPPTSNDGTADLVRYRIFARSTTGSPTTDTLVFDTMEFAVGGSFQHTLTLDLNNPAGRRFASGTYQFTAQSEDLAGNIALGEALVVTIEGDDVPPPITDPPSLLASSDTGMLTTDRVTRLNQLSFAGINEIEAIVTLFATALDANGNATGTSQSLGTTTIGGDASNSILGDDLGTWQFTTPPLSDGIYLFHATVVDGGANETITSNVQVIIDTHAPAIPSLSLLTDTGSSTTDRITSATRPELRVIASDSAAGGISVFPHDLKYRVYTTLPGSTGTEVLLVDSYRVNGGFATQGGTHILSQTLNSAVGPAFVSGVYPFRVEVEDRAGNVSQSFVLNVTIDALPPEVNFGTAGLSTDGLHPESDTGIGSTTSTLSDRVTFDTTPTLFGTATANAHVRLFLQQGATRVLLGQTTAVPAAGTVPPSLGSWQLTSAIDLNSPDLGMARDGMRTLVVTAEDVAGNVSVIDTLTMFLDTQAPVISAVTNASGRAVFESQPPLTPSPLSSQWIVRFSDMGTLASRQSALGTFPSVAVLSELALVPNHYRVQGESTGMQTIRSVQLHATGAGAFDRWVEVTVQFASPLPDDRFTLTVLDSITDLAGLALDGDRQSSSDSSSHVEFPTGDGQPGTSFAAQFIVDARPEIGTWGAGFVTVDMNGNWRLDASSSDPTYRDQQFTIGYASDDLFSGRFTREATSQTSGYDRIAAYGDVGTAYDAPDYRWLIDLNDDGVIDMADGDLVVHDPAQINGLPVAGNFDRNAANGDEVGLFTGSVWWLDTNHDYRVDLAIPTTQRGLPIVGDFNGDDLDDLGTYFEQTDHFQIDFASAAASHGDGIVDLTFRYALAGIRQRPAAADFDRDGIDDLVLWDPDHASSTSSRTANWHLFLSAGEPFTSRNQITPNLPGNNNLVSFGDRFALPLVGNFRASTLLSDDAPPIIETANPFFNARSAFDVNDDGFVSPLDALLVINQLDAVVTARFAAASAPTGTTHVYWDTNNDSHLSPIDAMLVINAIESEAASSANSAPRASLSLSVTAHSSIRTLAIDAVMQRYDTLVRRTS